MAKVGVIFPNAQDRGTHINISGAAVAKHAPNRANAVKMVEFLLSDSVQKVLAESNGEFPVVKTELPDHIKKLGEFKADTTSLAVIGSKTPEAVKIMDRSTWR
jgi:iron(III) transport system substrate-binding protein